MTQITTGESYNKFPSWSPDKSRIAFMRAVTPEEERFGDIFVVNFDGTGLRRLTHGGDYMYPDWSSSGDMLIFDGWTTGIQTVGLLGSQVRTVVEDNFADFPDWSPDGSQVAFNRANVTEGGVFVMNADGSNIKTLGVVGYFADWSPDGTKILYHSNPDVDGNRDIYVINADGTDLINLTAGRRGSYVLADWSPNGQKIALMFREEEGGNWEIGIMDAKGGPITNITNSPEDERYPQW
ncbi:MAG: PD40 domain-containing protein [Chloroflexi bacterium]|nr:PD40 domain-containing protein [Chloroflexota bacterium]